MSEKKEERKVTTHIPGVVALFSDEGPIPELIPTVVTRFYKRAMRYISFYRKGQQIIKKMKKLHDLLVEIAERVIPGLRGLEISDENLRLLTYPSESVIYDRGTKKE